MKGPLSLSLQTVVFSSSKNSSVGFCKSCMLKYSMIPVLYVWPAVEKIKTRLCCSKKKNILTYSNTFLHIWLTVAPKLLGVKCKWNTCQYTAICLYMKSLKSNLKFSYFTFYWSTDVKTFRQNLVSCFSCFFLRRASIRHNFLIEIHSHFTKESDSWNFKNIFFRLFVI